MIYIMYRISIKDFIYIGSTKDFKQRKISHKSVCYNEISKKYNLKIYEIIRQNGGWDNCEMVPIEEYNCETKLQAIMREEQLRIQYNANMNTQRAYISDEDFSNEQKEIKCKKYDCDCGGKYTYANLAKHKLTKKHLDYLVK